LRRLARTVRRQRTILGRLMRDVQRWVNRISQADGSGVSLATASAAAMKTLALWLERAERICTQQRHDKHKLYALHAPEVECIGKGKARKPYEFGVKVSLAITHASGLMVGARSFAGNPYDGHTLAEQLEQTNNLLQDVGTQPTTAIVDLGYRGVDQACAPVQIIHRGKFKSLGAQQRQWLKRRQAVEPAIGHAKSDNRVDRCWLQGATGDALHAPLCAAGLNIRWLPRAIARTAPTRLLAPRTHHTHAAI
jgi:transposase, IS5 family